MMQNTLHATDAPYNGRIARDRWIELLLQVRAAELSGAAKIAGACIAMHVDLNTRRCDLPVETIAELAGMDSRSVRRMIRKLEATGWLSVDRSVGYHPNLFKLTTPDEMGVTPSMVGGRANV